MAAIVSHFQRKKSSRITKKKKKEQALAFKHFGMMQEACQLRSYCHVLVENAKKQEREQVCLESPRSFDAEQENKARNQNPDLLEARVSGLFHPQSFILMVFRNKYN